MNFLLKMADRKVRDDDDDDDGISGASQLPTWLGLAWNFFEG